MDSNAIPRLTLLVGLKKYYTRSPSSVDSLLFHHSYIFVGDVEERIGEIVKDNDSILEAAPKVNVFKTSHFKSKLEDNSSITIFHEVANSDVQVETLKV